MEKMEEDENLNLQPEFPTTGLSSPWEEEELKELKKAIAFLKEEEKKDSMWNRAAIEWTRFTGDQKIVELTNQANALLNDCDQLVETFWHMHLHYDVEDLRRCHSASVLLYLVNAAFWNVAVVVVALGVSTFSLFPRRNWDWY